MAKMVKIYLDGIGNRYVDNFDGSCLVKRRIVCSDRKETWLLAEPGWLRISEWEGCKETELMDCAPPEPAQPIIVYE